MKKALLISPYLATLGGGERHYIDIFRTLCEQGGYAPHILSQQEYDQAFAERLHITFPTPPRYVHTWRTTWWDLIVYVTDGSYFFSPATRTICFTMNPDHALYRMHIINKLKTWNWQWITNSQFTRSNLQKCGIQAQVIYPVIMVPKNQIYKKTYIGTHPHFLLVGRFFSHLHTKRHDVAIAWFLHFIDTYPAYRHAQLTIVGGVQDEDRAYFEKIQTLARVSTQIRLIPNATHDELQNAYRTADVYVHFTGWGINDETNPSSVEHLGITPLEAIAHGLIPFGYCAGGIPEVVRDGITGYTFNSWAQLDAKILRLITDTALQDRIRIQGMHMLAAQFDQNALVARIKSII